MQLLTFDRYIKKFKDIIYKEVPCRVRAPEGARKRIKATEES